jgi:hypothetical protein
MRVLPRTPRLALVGEFRRVTLAYVPRQPARSGVYIR